MRSKKSIAILVLAICLSLIFVVSTVLAFVLGSNKSEFNAFDNYSEITSVEFDGDESFVVTKDNWISKYSADQMRAWEISVRDSVQEIAISEENVAVSYNTQRYVDVFDRETGETKYSYSLNYPVSAIEINNSGVYIAVKASLLVGSYVYFFRNYSYTPDQINVENEVVDLSIDNDGNKLYLASTDYNLYEITYSSEEEKLVSNNFAAIPFDPLGCAVIADEFVVADKSGNIHIFKDNAITDVIETGISSTAFGYNYEIGYVVIADAIGTALSIDLETGTAKKIKAPASVEKVAVSQRGVIALTEYYAYSADFIDIKNVGLLGFLNWAKWVALAVSVLCLAFLTIAIMAVTRKGSVKVKASIKKFKYSVKMSWKSYAFILPTIILLVMFMYIPTIWGLFLSFFDYVPSVRNRFVKFDNFVAVFNDPYFTGGIVNMLILLVTDLVKALIPAILLAECIVSLNGKKSQYWVRVLMYVPGLIPGVATLLIWKDGIYGQTGLMNSIITQFGLENIDWMFDSSTALLSLMIIGFPWVGQYILFYGALTGVPESYREAARLDGCNWAKIVWYVDLPAIAPQIKYVFTISFINSIQDFARIYTTTGQIEATNIPALQMYMTLSSGDYGKAAAMGMLIFIFIFGFSQLFNRLTREKKEIY